jgi:hypothetical protein
MNDTVWNRVGPETTAPRSALNSLSFVRLSGLALVVGSVVSVVFELVSGFSYGSETTYANQPSYIIAEFVLAAASILLLLGLPGVYASRAQRFGVVGLVGMAFVFTAGSLLGVFVNLESAMVDPWLATQAPSLANGFGPPAFFAFFNVAELLLVVGSVLLAISLLRGQISPRWPAFALLLSAVVGLVNYLFNASLTSTLASSLIGTVAPILLFVALAGLGYQAWSKPTPGAD